MIISVILLLILLLIKNSQYKKLLEENKKLKKQLEANSKLIEKIEIQKEQVIENEGSNKEEIVEQYLKVQSEQQEKLSQQFKEEQEINSKKEKRSKQEQKNISILITGAVCIVLSAIVFLMSTWNSIPNILKTVVLALLTLVFFGGSYIAKDKFKLDKASQTFFYIAMAYIPICLISISIFELLGTFLSIYGEGKYIYLMLASLFVAYIYYKTYTNKNNKYLLFGSLLSQVFTVVMFSLIFSNNLILIGINLLIYNILLMLITKKDIFIKVYNFIPIVMTVIAIAMLEEQSKAMLVMLTLLAGNFLILEFKKSQRIYSYMFNICMIVFGIYTVNIFNDMLGDNIRDVLVLCFIILLYIIENILLIGSKKVNLKNSLTVVTLVTIGILHIDSFENMSRIAPYIFSVLQIILLIITYIKSKERGKNITALLIPVYFIITGINIMSELECGYHAYIIFAFLTFILSEMFRKKDTLIHLNTFIISNALIVLTYIIVFMTNFNDFIDDIFYAILLTGMYAYSYLVYKNITFKYLAYITSNFILIAVFRFLIGESEILYYIPMISTLVIMGIELIYKELQDASSDIYLTFSKVISFAFIYAATSFENSEISTILAIIFTTIIMIDNIKNKEQYWNILPLTCAIPALFSNNLNTELQIGIMLLSVIATTGVSLKENKISIFTIFSGIYLFLTSLNIESIYLKEILFICWSVINFLFMGTEQEKDVFKFLSYVSTLFLYNTLITDLELEIYTVFSMLGYVLIAILTIRTIVIKYIENIDVLEYIVFGFIYLIALLQYTNESDGMLFGILLVTIVIVSYMKKYGALFMVSIFAILVNIFALTRAFWFSVPWWIYLLTVGAVLIGFSIKNEISDKKKEINAMDLLKSIKDKVEK